jgi:hypothetical protein
MTIAYLGSLSVGTAVPGASAAITAGLSGINTALPLLADQLAALQAFIPAPISFAAQLALAQNMVLSINAAITAGLPVPDLAAQIAIILAQIAALIAQLASIQAQVDILTALQSPLAAAGVHGYAFDGQTNQLGSELGGELASGVPGGSGTDHANALVLVTTIGATWDAMGLILKVSP